MFRQVRPRFDSHRRVGVLGSLGGAFECSTAHSGSVHSVTRRIIHLRRRLPISLALHRSLPTEGGVDYNNKIDASRGFYTIIIKNFRSPPTADKSVGRGATMPDRDVKTIQDLIYYQYAKIIVRRASGVSDGKEAKKQSYGLIKNKFRELKSGKISWSEITRVPCSRPSEQHSGIFASLREDTHQRHAGAGRQFVEACFE